MGKPTPLWKALIFERRIPTRYLTNNLILRWVYGLKLSKFHGLEEAWMINENFNQNLYCPKNFKIKKEDLIIDIGANMGIFSFYAAKKAKKGKIFSFEPISRNFRIFKKNIKFNKFKNINAFKLGVSGKNCKRKIFINQTKSMNSFFEVSPDIVKEVKINCVSLEDIFSDNKIQKCNFLKIDCEGAEYEILFEAPKKVLDRIDKISMEYHILDSKRNDKALIDFFKKNGFKIKGHKKISDRTGMIYAYR